MIIYVDENMSPYLARGFDILQVLKAQNSGIRLKSSQLKTNLDKGHLMRIGFRLQGLKIPVL